MIKEVPPERLKTGQAKRSRTDSQGEGQDGKYRVPIGKTLRYLSCNHEVKRAYATGNTSKKCMTQMIINYDEPTPQYLLVGTLLAGA